MTNLQGDVVAILDDTGNTVVQYSYDAWGNLLSTNGSVEDHPVAYNPLRYRGYVYDTETGFYYLQSRYYDPEVGRFLNADALVSTGQGLLGHNMFAYCRNNPVTRKDASGTNDVANMSDEEDGNPFNDIGGPKAGGGGSSRGNGTTTVYRSVGPNEALDIAKTGEFRTTNTSMACKQFGFNMDEVAQFGQKVGNTQIVSAEVPTSALDMFYLEPVDTNIFRSGTMTVYEELLGIFNELIKNTIVFILL